jgi:hypothetical protein
MISGNRVPDEGKSEMAKAYYSTVLEQPAAEVWKIVRDFNNYPVWVGGAGESRIEDGKTGDTVGAIRSVHYLDRHIRQRLLAQSDVERSQTYEFCDHAGGGWRSRLRRMVGDLRLRAAPLRGTDRNPPRLVRQMARIAACHAAKPGPQPAVGGRGGGLTAARRPF